MGAVTGFAIVEECLKERCAINKILYENEFSQHNLGLGYKPHMTVGKLRTVDALNEAYEFVIVDVTKRGKGGGKQWA